MECVCVYHIGSSHLSASWEVTQQPIQLSAVKTLFLRSSLNSQHLIQCVKVNSLPKENTNLQNILLLRTSDRNGAVCESHPDKKTFLALYTVKPYRATLGRTWISVRNPRPWAGSDSSPCTGIVLHCFQLYCSHETVLKLSWAKPPYKPVPNFLDTPRHGPRLTGSMSVFNTVQPRSL